MKKRIAILGSTGSIGRQALSVVTHLHDEVEVVALSAYQNVSLLAQQAIEYGPQLVAIGDARKEKELRQKIPRGIRVVSGERGLEEVATMDSAELVLSALVGAAGVLPTYRAIEAGKQIGLANKEVLVAAGELIMQLAKREDSLILPIDSEHHALFQCMQNGSRKEISKLFLTASGGPFLHFTPSSFANITPEMALSHPNWSMGKKITIDCSTMMNKGFEVIEAHHLFQIPAEKIEVMIHPQSIVHGMVEWVDRSITAHLSVSDMRIPIQSAFTYPVRRETLSLPFDFSLYNKLEFLMPDRKKFPCLDLAYWALKEGGTSPCFLSGANEVLVERFLNREIRWVDIGIKLTKLMETHPCMRKYDIETLLAVDAEARVQARNI